MRLVAAALLVVAAHAFCLANGFVDFDDDTIFLDNPAVRAGPVLDLFALDRPDWRPLRDLSHRLDWAIHGQDPLWAHAHNLLLLGLVVWLCARFFTRLGVSEGAAAVVAFLAFVHPVQVESVAWVSGRKELLAGACFFAMLLAFFAWMRGRGRRTRWRHWALLGVGGAFALGVMAKGHLVVAPAVLLALGAYLVFRDGVEWRRVIAPVVGVGLLALAAIPLVARGGVLLPDGITGDQFTVTPGDQLQIPLRYLVQLAWPVELNHIYLTPALGAAHTAWTVASVAVSLAILGAIALGLKRRRPWAAVACVPLALLLPYLHLRAGSVYMADRYLFLVVPFVMWLAWHGAGWVAARLELSLVVRRGAVISIALVWIFAGAQHHRAWRDSTTLWGRMIEVYPSNDWGWGRLGIALYRAGDYAAAGGAFVEASRRAPDRMVHRQNAAAAMAALGHEGAAAALSNAPIDVRDH